MLDLKKLEEWCRDAVLLLPTPELPRFEQRRLDTITRHSGTKGLHEIAADLAEGLSHLPEARREAAQRLLSERYGFGYDLFVDAKMKRVRALLRRGRIRNEDEHREVLDLLSDTTLNAALRGDLTQMLVAHEAKLDAHKSKPP